MTEVMDLSGNERWRIVVISNIQGGSVYNLVADVVAPLGHTIVGVVTTPGSRKRRDPAYLEVVANTPAGIEVLVTTRPSQLAQVLRVWSPDLVIVGGFPWKLPSEVLEVPRLGVINIHPALLPRLRGRFAFEWAFRSDEPEMGFTVHRMAPEFDTGPILSQVAVPIEDDDSVGSLLGKFAPLLPGMLTAALERVARGDPGDAQDESLATEAPEFEPEWRYIDWSRPARMIHNQVRSWTGARLTPKGAFGDIAGERLLIVRTLPESESGISKGVPPGSLIRREGDSMLVQCGDGPLRIMEWERGEPSQELQQSS